MQTQVAGVLLVLNAFRHLMKDHARLSNPSNTLKLVLNAFRHLMKDHDPIDAPSLRVDPCSTPFGI